MDMKNTPTHLESLMMIRGPGGIKQSDANIHCADPAGSELRHLLIRKIAEDCETWEPLSEVQKSAIAGTVMGMFSVVDIFGEVEAVEKWKQNVKGEHSEPKRD